MPRMPHESAAPIIEYFFKTRSPGSRSAQYCARNSFMTFVVRTCADSIENVVETWQDRALFVAENDLVGGQPYVMVVYVFSCGMIIATIIDRESNLKKYRSKSITFGREVGFKIDLTQWHEIGNLSELVKRNGDKRRSHLARKPDNE